MKKKKSTLETAIDENYQIDTKTNNHSKLHNLRYSIRQNFHRQLSIINVQNTHISRALCRLAANSILPTTLKYFTLFRKRILSRIMSKLCLVCDNLVVYQVQVSITLTVQLLTGSLPLTGYLNHHWTNLIPRCGRSDKTTKNATYRFELTPHEFLASL